MTTDQALKIACALLHQQSQQMEAAGFHPGARHYREAADLLDDLRRDAGNAVDIPDCMD